MTFYDLNVPVEIASPSLLSNLFKLGWEAVAINYSSMGRAPKQLCSWKHVDVPIRQYTRITISITDTEQNAAFTNSEILRSFDFIAVRPTTEKTFQAACQSLHVDIISLDLSDRLSFSIKHGLVREAIQRGVVFELSYGPSIIAPITNGRRRQALSGVMNLVRICGKGRGLISSFGCSQPGSDVAIRGPHDVRNWVEMVGLKADQSKCCIVDTPIRVIKHAGDRVFSYRGAVVKVDEGKDSDFYVDYLNIKL